MDPRDKYIRTRLATFGHRDATSDAHLIQLLGEIYDLHHTPVQAPSLKTIGKHYIDRAIGFLQETKTALDDLPE